MLKEISTFISEDEYFDMLYNSVEKLEYHDGEVVMMAGASFEHNIITSNLIRLLGNCLDEGECFVLNSDMLVKMAECYKYVFPDVVIVCKTPILTRRRGLDVLENPEIVIEVLSDSTELTDRVEKFDCYKRIKSVKEYILVASKRKKVEVFKRTKNNEWLLHDYDNLQEKVRIGDCEILLKEIYKKVIFEEVAI